MRSHQAIFALACTLLHRGQLMAIAEAVSTGECTDLHGRRIPHGIHYVPGPDACTLCVCDNGGPKLCKAVLCSPPQDCKTFIMGNFCCEFICLDNTLPVPPTSDGGNGEGTADLGLRLVASGVTAILSLSLLFFLIHRLRQRRIRGRQNRQLHEDQRSLGSVGYITGSIGYLPGSVTCLQGQERVDFLYDEPSSHYSWWKPPENYFPRGEAPPPYEEAVAAAQAEAAQAAAQGSAAQAQAEPGATAAMSEEVQASVVEGAAASTTPVAVPTSTTTVAYIEEPPGAVAALHPPVPPPPDTSSLLVPEAPASSEGATAAIPPPPSPLPALIPPLPATSIPTQIPQIPPIPSTSAAMATNLTTMNDLNKSNCSCVDDNDDYRSECENCKSARGSRYLDEPNITPHETMTLHRRPPTAGGGNTAHGYRTSLTLPSQARRHREGTLLPGGAREAAVQRFSLQLVLDWSDSSSSSLTLSPERRTASPSSSSSSDTSSDINTHI